LDIHYDSKVKNLLSKLSVCLGIINNVHVEKGNDKIRRLKEAIYEEVRARYSAEELKNNPTVRAYRDFYWRLGVDPTKTRPSGEALLRRILHGDELPCISTAVDAYNLASIKTIIPISGLDADHLNPPLQIRFAESGEAFQGIGMAKPISLTQGTLILADRTQVLCIYPYRDSDQTKIGMWTRNVILIAYGVPGILEEQLKEAVEIALSHIKQISGGEGEMVRVFSSAS
jgi:DNA/RNA-binding domain of Phe-tRNA-synthetase-like protein